MIVAVVAQRLMYGTEPPRGNVIPDDDGPIPDDREGLRVNEDR